MPHYCHQVSYTKEAWARLMADPQDRLDIVRLPIEKLGGKLHSAFFAFGPFDVRGHRDCVCRRRRRRARTDHPADDCRASHRSYAQGGHLRV
jgi:hypothetical protein